MTDDFNRRDFIKKVAAGAVSAGAALPALGQTKKVSANDKVVVGIVGSGGRGRGDLSNFIRQPDVEVAAVCDVYKPNLDKGLEDTGGKAQTYTDFRQVLDRKDIDVIVVGTPDHWHPLVMVEACKAGKDVYVEKPICHTIDEGILMVEAARKYNRVAQVGTQQRSGIHFQKAVKLVQDGFIGKVSFVRTWNYANEYPQGHRQSAGFRSALRSRLECLAGAGARKFPSTGTALEPDPNIAPRWSTFRYFWDYAGGYMTDWGVHLIDIVQWAMQVEAPNGHYRPGREILHQATMPKLPTRFRSPTNTGIRNSYASTKIVGTTPTPCTTKATAWSSTAPTGLCLLTAADSK